MNCEGTCFKRAPCASKGLEGVGLKQVSLTVVSLSDMCQWNTTKCRVGVLLTLTNLSYRLSDESFRPCLNDLKRNQEKSMDLFFVTGFGAIAEYPVQPFTCVSVLYRV